MTLIDFKTVDLDGKTAADIRAMLDHNAAVRKAEIAATGRLGLITVLPEGVDPEVFAFQQGLA